jgi:hypothetical protein
MPITVSSLYIYPVKGLKGIEVAEARCTDRGFADDRRFMVVTPGGRFLTQRSHPRMATIWTEIVGDALELAAPDQPPLQVPLRPAARASLRVVVWQSTVDAAPVSPEADAWLSEALGTPCRLVHMPDASERLSNAEFAGPGKRVSFADGYAYLMIGSASLRDLNARLGEQLHPPLPMNRFRPGIVVEGAAPYAEDGWGRTAIGGAVLRGVKPCGRCEVTTTDQATGEVRGPEPLATLATYRSSDTFGVMFGMNFVTESEGRIAVGDLVSPERGDSGREHK